jgi:myo-inositol 2-dehydrogenase / D-chiro-inositol 1-dehydrogenase
MIRRREFMVSSAAAMAAHAAPPERELRVASVGIGVRGTSLLSQALAQQNVRIAAICDIEPQARDKGLTSAAQHKPKSVTDYRQLIDMKDIDALLVATPCDLHAEMATACLQAGKYVYCEKPLGVTPEQVDMALRASAKSKAFLQIGQQLRYFPVLREAMRLLHQERVAGQIFVVKAQRHSTPSRPEQQRARPAWYEDVRRSGDLIVENAVHNIDACNWIIDSRPVSAYGHGKKYLPTPIPAGTQMMDGFSVEYIYDNDAHLDYSQLYLHARGLKTLPNGQWYMIFGDKGTVHLTHDDALFYPMQGGEAQPLISAEIKAKKENAMEEFFACIRENRKPFADIRVAATAALTAILGREAIYKRRSMAWKELGVTI